MTEVGRRPTLYELLLALHAIRSVESDAAVYDPEAKTFRVVLTFTRAQCPNDWIEGQPKPTWLFEQLTEELAAWLQQRNREEQWVSKEEQMGSSIDTLMAHYTEELKRHVKMVPQNIGSRLNKRIFTDTILRLQELKERRVAGGVYSQTESRREKARKQWADDEYEAPKREQEQRRQQEKSDFGSGFSYDDLNEQQRRTFDDLFGSGPRRKPSPSKSGSKRPWHVVLEVSATATTDEIEKSYRRLANRYHPDRCKDVDAHQRMVEINAARDERLGGL